MKRNLNFWAVWLALILWTPFAYAQPIYSPVTGHWYELNSTNLTFQDAQTYAVSKGGYLASITSANENLWISNTFTAEELDYTMIGGNDIQQEGNWKWINGESWAYTNWVGIEPNNGHGDEDWAAFKTFKSGPTDFWWVEGAGYGWLDVGRGGTYRPPLRAGRRRRPGCVSSAGRCHEQSHPLRSG